MCAPQLAMEEKRLRAVEKEKREIRLHTLQQITEESRILYEAYAMEGAMSWLSARTKKRLCWAGGKRHAKMKQRRNTNWNRNEKSKRRQNAEIYIFSKCIN